MNAESKTSILSFRKSAANSRSPCSVRAIASPVYPASGTVTLSSALPMSGSTLGLHASMWPSSVAKMNAAGALTVPFAQDESGARVGHLAARPGTESGMVTCTAVDLVAVLEPAVIEYSVALSLTWLEIHNGEVGDSELPQGFFRLGSVTGAMPGTSEARSTWFNVTSPGRGPWWPLFCWSLSCRGAW